jgi:hypothetical protein
MKKAIQYGRKENSSCAEMAQTRFHFMGKCRHESFYSTLELGWRQISVK